MVSKQLLCLFVTFLVGAQSHQNTKDLSDKVIEIFHKTQCFYCNPNNIEIEPQHFGNGIYFDSRDKCTNLCNNNTDKLIIEFAEQQDCKLTFNELLELYEQDDQLSEDYRKFADVLVFDDRTNTCFSFDPRDEIERPLRLLQTQSFGCQSQTSCFNCSYTASVCEWKDNSCQTRSSSSPTLEGASWWENYEVCEDNLGLCRSALFNEEQQTIEATVVEDSILSNTNSLNQLLDTSGKSIFFGMESSGPQNNVPRNYYCSWELSLKSEGMYYIMVQRSNYREFQEEIEIRATGFDGSEEVVENFMIKPTDSYNDDEQVGLSYQVTETQNLNFYVRNKYDVNAQTFIIKIEKQTTENVFEGAPTSIIYIACIVGLTCVCFVVLFLSLRMRRRERQRVAHQEARVAEIERQNEARRDSRSERLQNAEGRERQRLIKHAKLLVTYKQLMPEEAFNTTNKKLNHFDVSECAVCFDNFENGQNVRQVPPCHHIFHSECLMKWLEQDQQIDQQKCPFCNLVLTPLRIRVALEDLDEDKKNSQIVDEELARSNPVDQNSNDNDQEEPVVENQYEDQVEVDQEDLAFELNQANADEDQNVQNNDQQEDQPDNQNNVNNQSRVSQVSQEQLNNNLNSNRNEQSL